MADYSDKVDALLEHTGDFDDEDFKLLALAALDQAGYSANIQRRIAHHLCLDPLDWRKP